MSLRLATTPEEIARCYSVMHELRPHVSSVEEFVTRVQRQQDEGFHLAFLEDGSEIVTLAGFRVQHMLATGLTMYVDDLVTSERARSRGHGKTMLDALIAEARARGCETFSLDSGTHRREAHAFYFREGMRISSFHFMLSLD
ncbi:MAG TPA: GNAT family N-acetyltransferase [Acidobacteriaceae bacterium]|jgi:GNAT superfamily N-acetyltransferase